MSKWKVYISSTFRDLHEFRAELRSYFEKQFKNNFELSKIMELMFDEGRFTLFTEECIEEIENCDIYILILGNKIGSYPPNENRTYTEIELDTALLNKKKIFCFRIDPFVESEIDNKTKHQEILNKFKGKATHRFNDIESLKLTFQETLNPFASLSPINKENPYKGLASFEVTDGDTFFGRKAELEECLKKIINGKHFISIIGNSGIGKTSFAQAGLLYRLKTDETLGYSNFEQIIVVPGKEPYSNLKYQLTKKGKFP